jgi:hypothetical protein
MSEPTDQTEQPHRSPDDHRAHAEHEHVAAVFADREHAADAIDRLRVLGIETDHLGVALHGDESVVFEHDDETELLRDTASGVAVGAPIGAVAGVALAALAVPGLGIVGLGGMFAFAGASALWGGMIGGYLGAAAGLDGWDAHADIRYTALEPGEVLVVVCSHGHADDVRHIMQRDGGKLRSVTQTELGRREIEESASYDEQ